MLTVTVVKVSIWTVWEHSGVCQGHLSTGTVNMSEAISMN